MADDIFCVADGPRILDCLEFDDRLRYLDVLDDVAFLAMDLERLAAPDAARDLLDWYAKFSRASRVLGLEHHYVAYVPSSGRRSPACRLTRDSPRPRRVPAGSRSSLCVTCGLARR